MVGETIRQRCIGARGVRGFLDGREVGARQWTLRVPESTLHAGWADSDLVGGAAFDGRNFSVNTAARGEHTEDQADADSDHQHNCA